MSQIVIFACAAIVAALSTSLESVSDGSNVGSETRLIAADDEPGGTSGLAREVTARILGSRGAKATCRIVPSAVVGLLLLAEPDARVPTAGKRASGVNSSK